jgi:hypothetical protein
MIVGVSILLAVFILTFVTWMLLTRRLREKYAVLWLVIGASVLIVGLFPGLLEGLTQALGVQLPSNLLFASAILLLLGVSLHLSWELSLAEDEVRRLAEESAILRADVDELSTRVRLLEPDQDGPSSA